MNLRKRKKEPPDPWLSIFDFPIANSYLVDLAISLPISRAPFPAIPFPCPLLDFALFSVSKPFPIYSPPQPVVGLQFMTRSTRGSASTPRMVLSPQFRGPRPGIVERSCQGSRFCTEHGVTEWSLLAVSLVFHLAVFRSEAQVCFFTFPLQTCCCNCVLCTSGALPSFCHLPPILALGKRFGLVPESTRPCAEVLAGHGVCQHRRLWVATPSIFGCRHRSKYSVSPWPSSHGLRPRVVCIRSKVSAVFWLEIYLLVSDLLTMSFVLRLGYWRPVFPACTVSVEGSARSYALFPLALLFPRSSLPFRWLFFALQWLNFGSLLLLLFDLISVKWVHLCCLGSIHCYIVCCLDYFRALLSSALLYVACVCWNGPLHSTWHWSNLGSHWLVGDEVPAGSPLFQLLFLMYGGPLMKWLHTYCILVHPCYIDCCFADLVYFSLFLPRTLCVPAGRKLLIFSPFSSLLVRDYTVSVAPFFWLIRVFLCSLRPTHYGNFFNSVMKPWVLNSELEIDFTLHWMLPSVLLSLCLVALYAQNHVIAYSRWHLNSFQTARDEVKGLYPLAYDDYSTEAFLILSLLPSSPNLFALCIQCVWPLGLLQMFWQATQDLLARPFCAVFIIFLRPEYHAKGEVVKLRMMRTHTLELPVNKLYMSMVVQCFGIQCWLNVIVEWIFECFQLAQGISVNWSCKCSFAWKRLCAYCYWITIHPLLWTLWLRMYCSPKPVLDYINCTADYTVSVHYGCVLVIVVSCNQYFVSILEQHIRVLGPCYKALDQHLRMLGPVFARFYYSYYNDALKWNDLFLRSEI